MKRLGGRIYERISDVSNINLADESARKNKIKSRKYIAEHDKFKAFENYDLSEDLKNFTYKTSPYSKFKVYEPKERIIYKLPYYPDRICHHAILNVLKFYWERLFIYQTYSCIKGRGIHKCLKDVKKALVDKKNTRYCLEIDIKKFYPSINHQVLKDEIRKKIKDKHTLWLLDELIDSVKTIPGYKEKGVPIGNWTSQYFGNLILTPLDRFCKQELKCRYYFRYADDIRILSNNKNYLKKVLCCIKLSCKQLKLKVKNTYRIVDMKKNGTDFLGYVMLRNHVLLRKRMKLKMFRTIRKFLEGKITEDKFQRLFNSYRGWLKYCNSKHLLQKIKSLCGIAYHAFDGEEKKISRITKDVIYFVDIDIRNTYFLIYFIFKGNPYYVKSRNRTILELIKGLRTRDIVLRSRSSLKRFY